MITQIEPFVMLAVVLFVLGTMGVLLRRSAILIFMSVELMLNAANLALIVAIFRTKHSINVDDLHQMEG